ncbi:MAG: hypothetical protein BroJett040_24350 [Oligoflexia bacterium]|nr:MAG: hypothetical protein BroJett040_24350 [Oligoflexia bacterium]
MRSAFFFISLMAFGVAGAQMCQPSEFNQYPSVELKWTLQGDFERLNDYQIPISEKERTLIKGQLTIQGKTYPVQMKARGKFRYEECQVRPFSVEFLTESPFGKKGKKLKLATLCYRDRDLREVAERQLLKEVTIYKMIQVLKGPHLDVHPIQVVMKTPNGDVYLKAPAFIRESESALAKRCDLREREAVMHRWNQEKRTFEKFLVMPDKSLKAYDYELEKEALLRMEVTNRFLNNIDYLVEEDHNVIPLALKDPMERKLFVIPYDFDLSQAADGSYYSFVGGAKENAQALKNWISTTTDFSEDLKLKIMTELIQAKPEMRKVIHQSLLDSQGKRELLDWLNAFE